MATATEPQVITLDTAAVKRLVESGSLPTTAVSPLSTVLRGSSTAPAPSADDLEAFRPSIEIVARPEAYVRILTLRPDAEDEDVIGLLVRAGQAVSFTLKDDALHLGRPQPLAAVVASLAPALAHQGPLAGNEVWLWPSVVQLLTGLWQDQPDPSRGLSRGSVVERLTTPEYSQAEAEQFLKDVAASGVVRMDGDQLSIDAGLQPWLALLWSGHALQVERVELPADVPLEQAIEGARELLLFLGPAGQRVQDRAVSGEALSEHLGGRKPREASMLHLSAPGTDEVAKALAALLKLG